MPPKKKTRRLPHYMWSNKRKRYEGKKAGEGWGKAVRPSRVKESKKGTPQKGFFDRLKII